MLVSPTNQLLLLHRVQTSTSFAAAHVFPGGNLSKFHEVIPAPDAADRHADSVEYRRAAVRETFEESGILLARKAGSPAGSPLLELSDEVREEARKLTHGNKVKFADWLKSVGGEPDLGTLGSWLTSACQCNC
jgi:8-oxo-dGTP pyrophosphatase MutT (NUDIX family)